MLPALLLVGSAKAPMLRLSPLFGDGAVLQRGMAVPVFGSSAPGAEVAVTLGGAWAKSTADAAGRWVARFGPLKGTGPFVLTASSGGETVSARDLLCGEVWIAAGQSNMEFPESKADDYDRARSESSPNVRAFAVEKAATDEPQNDVKGGWEASSAETIGRFSAVALAFARELNRKLGVPVGILSATWGGSPAEAWTPRQALAGRPSLKPLIEAYDAAQGDYPTAIAAYRRAISEYVDFKHNGGNEGFMHDWQAVETGESDWATVPAATPFPADFDGAAWYRKTVDVPAEWLGKPLVLSLGAVDDYDTTYFDGIRVGRTGIDAPAPRQYRIAPGVVRAGRNVIAVRVFDTGGAGGILGPVSEMRLALADGSASIPLDGDWRFRIEKALDPKTQIPERPVGPGNPNVPAALYNGMLAPLAPYAVRGAIWYQGEANVGRAAQYRDLFPAMVESWRTRWGEGYFPFYAVQLANYLPPKPEPSESAWAALREAQTSILSLPNTGLAVTIDLGAADDIHPTNKREVGRRLALEALGRTYRLPLVYEGPTFVGLRVAGDLARVDFRNGALLTSDATAPKGFQIAGDDGRWSPALARIAGSTVVLSSSAVPHPVAVRYAWADNPEVNLVNHAGLPAMPFRTSLPG